MHAMHVNWNISKISFTKYYWRQVNFFFPFLLGLFFIFFCIPIQQIFLLIHGWFFVTLINCTIIFRKIFPYHLFFLEAERKSLFSNLFLLWSRYILSQIFLRCAFWNKNWFHFKIIQLAFLFIEAALCGVRIKKEIYGVHKFSVHLSINHRYVSILHLGNI